jgi:hypothetical protein
MTTQSIQQTSTTDKFTRARPWLADLFISVDFGAGILGGIAGYFAITSSDELHKRAIDALLIQAGLGVAILAVALAALAILVSLLGAEYLVVLERADGGVSGAFFPYKSVAVVSCLAAIAALGSAFVWPLASSTVQGLLFGLSTLCTVWALVGTAQLAFITANHGTDRADVLREMREAEQQDIKRRLGVR